MYLLDETLELDNAGLISTNMAELLVKGITEPSYRECASKAGEMAGQTISAMGVWNVIQALGRKVWKAVRVIMGLLEKERIDDLFGYLEIYRDSLWDEGEIKDAEELIRYYGNSRKGLIPYQSRGLEPPEHPERLEYRDMGTMETMCGV